MAVLGNTNGTLKATPEELKAQRLAVANAPTINEFVWARDRDDQPVIKWDSAFEEILEERSEIISAARKKGLCFFPWEILKSLPDDYKISDRLFWNQGSVPSCALHGTTHAAECNLLIEIALGAPRKYEALNPIYPFYIARGGNMAGGLSLISAANQIASGGQYPVSKVGDNNTSAPRDYTEFENIAKQYQAACVYLEGNLTDKVFRACKAGYSVCFASSSYFPSAQIDNGIKRVSGSGYGGHAQAFTAYRKYKGIDFVFLINSWGDRYGRSEEGEPASGAWASREDLEEILNSAALYGAPFIPLSESPNRARTRIFPDFKAIYPKTWKGEF